MSTERQRAPRFQLPRIPAEQDQHGDLVEADLDSAGHGPQPVDVLRNIALLESRPFGNLHAGQAGALLDGKALPLAD